MTAVAVSLRHRVPRRAAVPFAAAGRLLRLELRRNVMIWVLPLLGALFWFDAYRTAMSYPAVWDLRASVIPDKVMIDFATFVAGASAWMGSRETRRRATDLVTTTGRPGWARLSATLAATLAWVMAGYLACVAVLYGATAAQAFRPYLAEVTAALRPALSLVAGLPGAPVRVSEVATSLVASTNQQAEVAGRPLVYDFAMPPTPGSLVRIAGENFTESLQIAFVTTVIGGSAPGQNDPETGDQAQQAVETVLLRQVAPELTNDTLGPPGSAAAVAAIGRFAALSAAERHAWLAAHLGALRAGRITLEELP